MNREAIEMFKKLAIEQCMKLFRIIILRNNSVNRINLLFGQ